MTTDRVGRADGPWQRRWMWNRRVAPRWLLVGCTGTQQYDDEDAVALCADIDGLFVDLPPRPRERFTLLGCAPDGALASVLDSVTHGTAGSGRAWLGNLWVSAAPDDPAAQRGWIGEQLLDVIVLDNRPSVASPGCVDIELEGLVDVSDRTDGVGRPDDVTGFVLRGPDDARWGACADVTGPGGYFGWNLDALDDCLIDKWGARVPFEHLQEKVEGDYASVRPVPAPATTTGPDAFMLGARRRNADR